MQIRRIDILAAVGLLFIAVVGCSRQDQPDQSPTIKESGHEFVPTPLECLKIELTNIAETVKTAYPPQYDYVAVVGDRLAALSSADREIAFDFMVEVFAKPKLKEFPLSQRESSLGTYMSVVGKLAPVFASHMEDQSKSWEFLLGTLSVLDQEHKTVSAPDFNPGNPPMGIIQREGDYLVHLYHRRFRAVREWFEISMPFSSFYRSLPDDVRIEWQAKLENAAQRKVVVYDPADAFQQLPRRKFTVSPYLPADQQEKKRAERRKALIEAGIDPAEEGL